MAHTKAATASTAPQVHWGFFASALVIEASLLTLHKYEATRIPVVPFVLHFLTAFGAYAAVLPLLFRHTRTWTGPSLSLILGCALVFRLTALLIPPIWDDDLYRYLWDGRVGIHGINPYVYAPDAPELESLQDDHYDLVSFKSIRTIYPPLFQFLFQLSQWIAPSSLFFLKSLALLFDLALIVVLLSLLRNLGYPVAWILIYAWNPLPIKEFANSGHMDSLVLFLLFLALKCVLDGRMVLAHLTLGLSVLAKLFSSIALPFFLLVSFRKGRRAFLTSLAAFAVVLLLGYIPFAEAGTRMFEALSIYSRYWNFNAGPFWLVEAALNRAGWNTWWLSRALILTGLLGVITWQLIVLRGHPWRRSASDDLFVPLSNGDCAKGARGSAGFVAAHSLSPLYAQWGENGWLPASTQSIALLKAVFYSLAALVLLSPAVQPWYICWLVPFCVFFPKASWISLSGLAVLSYLFYLNFSEMAFPRSIEFGIPAAIALWERARNENWHWGDSNVSNMMKEPL